MLVRHGIFRSLQFLKGQQFTQALPELLAHAKPAVN
jgi:hypothetical protein